MNWFKKYFWSGYIFIKKKTLNGRQKVISLVEFSCNFTIKISVHHLNTDKIYSNKRLILM